MFKTYISDTLTWLYTDAKILGDTQFYSYSLGFITSSKPKDVGYHFKSPFKECYSDITDNNYRVFIGYFLSVCACVQCLCVLICVLMCVYSHTRMESCVYFVPHTRSEASIWC